MPRQCLVVHGAMFAAVLALAALLPASAAQSLACPEPHPAASPGVMKESATQLAETGSYLAASGDPSRIPEVVADLRQRHPGVSDNEVENYLVAAYCPEVARLNGLGSAEQRSRVDRFALQAEAAIHQR